MVIITHHWIELNQCGVCVLIIRPAVPFCSRRRLPACCLPFYYLISKLIGNASLIKSELRTYSQNSHFRWSYRYCPIYNTIYVFIHNSQLVYIHFLGTFSVNAHFAESSLGFPVECVFSSRCSFLERNQNIFKKSIYF